jgi:hypothetical protein
MEHIQENSVESKFKPSMFAVPKMKIPEPTCDVKKNKVVNILPPENKKIGGSRPRSGRQNR